MSNLSCFKAAKIWNGNIANYGSELIQVQYTRIGPSHYKYCRADPIPDVPRLDP